LKLVQILEKGRLDSSKIEIIGSPVILCNGTLKPKNFLMSTI